MQRHNLRERYSPESHVELPIRQALQAVARNPELLAAPATWAAEITYKMDGADGSLTREQLSSAGDRVRQACEPLLQGLGAPPAALEASVPLEGWATLAAAAIESISEALTEVEDIGRSAYGLMLLISTEPENLFNANWLHKDLWLRQMPQRDAAWSVFLAVDDLEEGGAVVSLIDWAWEADANEVDEQRLWLAAVTLTWFLSTSNRAVRDRSTKALVNLLSCELGHAAALVDQFADVDDMYITERLLAACYGAATQGMDRARCRVLAASVWENYFAEGKQPPLNVLARDYAFGVLLYAQAAGQLPAEVDLDACKAKFKSAWPLEPVTEDDLKKYRGRGYGDSICSSTNKHGDFGNYTLRHWLHDIVDAPRDLAGNTTKELFERWETALMDKGRYRDAATK